MNNVINLAKLCLSKYILLSNSAFSTTIAYLSKGYFLFENGSSEGFEGTLSNKNTNRNKDKKWE